MSFPRCQGRQGQYGLMSELPNFRQVVCLFHLANKSETVQAVKSWGEPSKMLCESTCRFRDSQIG